MLTPISRAGRRTFLANCEDGQAVFTSEAGILRLEIINKDTLRVSFCNSGIFDPCQGEFLKEYSRDEIAVEEDEEYYTINTGKIVVNVNKETGKVAVNKSGSVLFTEDDSERLLEKFEAMRLKKDGKIDTVDVPTADGVKKRVVNAEKEYYKTLYHTQTGFRFEPNEMIFGLGQYEEGVWNYRGTTRYLHQANKQISMPMFVSSKGYGVMFTTGSPAIFNDNEYGTYMYTTADYYIDYFVMAPDGFEEIIDRVRSLNGKAAMLPKWAFSYVQSKERYETQDEIVETAKEFGRRKIPLGCIVLDWFSWEDGMWGQKTFDASRFPDVPAMVKELHELGTHFMMSIWPAMDPKSDNFREMKEAGQLLPGNNVYDAYSAEGRRIYWKQVVDGLASKGVESWWCDSSEPMTPEWETDIKPVPEIMFARYLERCNDSLFADKGNTYGLYHARGLYEGSRETYPDRRVLNLTRSGYFGSGSYGAVLWSGDISATWDVLDKQVVAGLQLAMCGNAYWTLDIGAFFIKKGRSWYWNGDYEDTTDNPGYKELYVRWFQFGAFLSMFRSHGTDAAREPWQFGEEGDIFYDALVGTIRLRETLMPYLYSLAAGVCLENKMFIKPLFFEFPEDKVIYDCSRQFMIGDSLMAVPVTKPLYYDKSGNPVTTEVQKVHVYLPGGTDWFDFYTAKRYEGGQNIEIEAPMSHIPLFVKSGSIIPLAFGENIEVNVYPGASVTFKLYNDNGTDYGYERGEYAITEISYDEETKMTDVKTVGDENYKIDKKILDFSVVTW